MQPPRHGARDQVYGLKETGTILPSVGSERFTNSGYTGAYSNSKRTQSNVNRSPWNLQAAGPALCVSTTASVSQTMDSERGVPRSVCWEGDRSGRPVVSKYRRAAQLNTNPLLQDPSMPSALLGLAKQERSKIKYMLTYLMLCSRRIQLIL